MAIGVMGMMDLPRTRDEKREVLITHRPKIVDEKKFHGPVVVDFSSIRRRMKEIS